MFISAIAFMHCLVKCKNKAREVWRVFLGRCQGNFCVTLLFTVFETLMPSRLFGSSGAPWAVLETASADSGEQPAIPAF